MELISLDNVRAVLEEYGRQAEEIYKYQISLGGHNASRDLVNTIKANVGVDNNVWEVSLTLNHYWKYLEGGSRGAESSPSGAVYPAHRPPAWALERWISVKPVIPRPRADGSLPSPKQLAYAMRESIYKKGIEPFPALQTTIDELNEIYKDKFVIALSQDVGVYINKVLRGLSGATMMSKL